MHVRREVVKFYDHLGITMELKDLSLHHPIVCTYRKGYNWNAIVEIEFLKFSLNKKAVLVSVSAALPMNLTSINRHTWYAMEDIDTVFVFLDEVA